MNGSKMMQNSMENRVLEEEEDVFGDMTAQLSGSQYAVLKNQAEREVRSLISKQKQHDMDQIYLHNAIPKEKGFIAGAERRISIESANLKTIGKHFPNGKIDKITIGKLTFDGIESMGDFFKEQNSKMEDMVEQVENGADEANSTIVVNVNGLDFAVNTHVGRRVSEKGQGTLGFDTERSVTFSCDALGLKDVSVKGNRLKGVMIEISENIATGSNSRKLLSDAQYSLKTHSEQLFQMEARYGKDFQFGNELEEAKARLDLYESKMREEMAEKEKKYAELDKDVEAATDVELTDEEEQADAPDEESTTKFREIEDGEEFYDKIDEIIETRVNELSQKLHTPIRIISNPEEIAKLPSRRHQRAKGWATEDGEIVVVVPNNDNVADIENTVVHEVIGHDGLRAFIGEERFEEFLGEVYDHAGAGIKKAIDKRTQTMVDNEADRLTRQKGGGVFAMAEARVEAERKRKEYRKEATEEYMADMAGRIGDKGFEQMNQEEMSLWGKIKAKVMQFLDKFLRGLGIPKSIRLTDKDLAYILFKSWRRKRGMDGVFAKAEDVIMRKKLHYNESKAEAEYALETANRRFNGQLAKYAEGKLSTNALIHLGEPMGVMREFLPSKPIVMRPRILRKASETKHNIDLAQLKDLPKLIAEPIFVFQRSDNAIGILTEIKDRTGKNVCVAIELNKSIQAGAEYFEVNDVRSIHGRDAANIILPIVYNNTLRYADKKKGLEWLSSASSNYQQEIAKQDLDMATKVVENFENPSENAENVRFRDGDDLVSRTPVMARAIYEDRVASSSYQVREALQDSMLGLMEAYRAIDKASGRKRRIEDVPEAENAYLDENRMSSVNQAEQEAYERLAIKPMLDEVARLAKDEAGYDDLQTYMMAKHGLERNALMRDRAKADGMDADKADEKDFAGLTGLFNTDDVADAEAQAEALVNSYEAAHQTDELWKLVNAATKASLSKMYECGLLGKDKYDEIKGMYDFYIPLRGWSETTADEVYGYIARNDSNLRGSVLKTAKGRRSVADDPIATIAMIGQQAIAQANRNRMKQKFLTYVLKNPSDLVSVSQLWLRKNEITDEWEPVFADIKDTDDAATVQRKIVDFEEEMKRLSAAEPDKYKTGRQAKSLPYKVGNADMREHTVLVKRGDYTYVMTINGNPRAAQALNGLTNPDVGTGWASALFGLGEKMNHFIAPIYTTRNPDFMVGNLFRDAFYGNTMVWVKESPRYAARLNANFIKVNPARMVKLISRYENGRLDVSNPIERQFHEFMMNGGETGYTNQADIEKQKKEVKRMLKRAGKKITFGKVMDIFTSKWDMLNSAVENSMRFATYLTSRQEGRSTLRSIYDSKEASVNFNKKGAGATFMGATGQTTAGKTAAFVSGTGRGLFVFWNAAIQGSFGNFFKYGARNPKKMAGAVASVFLLGVMQAILGAMDDDEDSKDNYFNQPDYTRRSNILLRVGDQYLAHPLPIEYVQVFGMGEMAATLMMGKEEMTAGEIAVNVAKMMSEYTPLPIDRAGLDHGIMPSSVKPIYEASINESWTGMPIYKQTPFNTNMPEWTKAYKSTSHQLVNLSEAMNRRSGGDEYTKGTIDFNPAQVEYVLRGYLSGYYGTVEKMFKSYETIVGDREFEWRNVPLFNRVVKQGDERTANRRMTNDFFEYMNEYEETKRRINSYSRTRENLFKYAETLSEMTKTPEFHRYWLIDRYNSRLNAIDQQLKRATTEEKAEELINKRDALRKEIVDKLKGRIPEEKRDTLGLGRQYDRYRRYVQQ